MREQKITEKQTPGHFFLFDQSVLETVSQDTFSHDYWYALEAVAGTETGRGTTLFLHHQEHELVLRHYLRGGFISKFNKDRYWFKSWERTRSVAEFNILNTLQNMSLPVPRPIAAQAIRKGRYYSADIIIERIPDAHDLLHELKQGAKPQAFYASLAKTIARFHRQGVYHADLNIQNILFDQQENFWLIDFDRARLLQPDSKWQNKTINRLKRSFEKEVERHQIHWQRSDWKRFIEAYLQAMSA